jgi:hypothetical protein
MQWCLMHAAHTLCCTAAFLQVTAVGAGLLLGSALCIILPEGFEAAIQVLFWGSQGLSTSGGLQRCISSCVVPPDMSLMAPAAAA